MYWSVKERHSYRLGAALRRPGLIEAAVTLTGGLFAYDMAIVASSADTSMTCQEAVLCGVMSPAVAMTPALLCIARQDNTA